MFTVHVRIFICTADSCSCRRRRLYHTNPMTDIAITSMTPITVGRTIVKINDFDGVSEIIKFTTLHKSTKKKSIKVNKDENILND
jgi:hypothetical protein